MGNGIERSKPLDDPLLTRELDRLYAPATGHDGVLPDAIEDSWKRCLVNYNLVPDQIPSAEVWSHAEVRDLLAAREELLIAAEPEVEQLFLRLVDSEYLIALASAEGVMMLFRCDYQFLGGMSKVGVLPGSVWTEDRQGTNGIGTCIIEQKPTTIVGDQHFGLNTKPLSCMTSPVFGPDGRLECVINVTSGKSNDPRSERIVQDIVQRAARRIENRYFDRIHRNNRVIRVAQDISTGDLAEEGRIALDDHGHIIAGSSHLKTLVNRPLDKIVGNPVDGLFSFGEALDSIRPGHPVSLRTGTKSLQAVVKGPEAAQTSRPAIASRDARAATTLTAAKLAGVDEAFFLSDPTTEMALQRAHRLLDAGLPLFISGEHGTGKTMFAQKVARNCLTNEGDLVFLDCASLDDTKAPDVFLGLGHGSRPVILLLDNIESLGAAGQTALQTLLENDLQLGTKLLTVISVSSTDLATIMREGTIQPRLLTRLKGGAISREPLRARADLNECIKEFLAHECKALGEEDISLGTEVEAVLQAYHWPGNLRELRMALRHAVVLTDGLTIDLEHLPEEIVAEISGKDLTARSQAEASRIEAALRFNDGNVTRTARYLGMSRATLYRKIEIQRARSESLGKAAQNQK